MATATNARGGKKKKRMEFVADNIDNTAPVEKIIDDLQHNHQAYTFFCRNVQQRNTTAANYKANHHLTPGYPLNNFTQDWDGNLNFDYFEDFSYKSQKPKFLTPLRNMDKSDPVTKIVKLMKDWETDIKSFRCTAGRTHIMEKFETLNEDVVRCPKYIINIAAHLDSPPDPYFDSPYNWYYAGHGNMQLVCINWIDYLLHSDLNSLYMSQIYKDNLHINFSDAIQYDCGKDTYILETICSSQQIVALRTKHKIIILKIVQLEKLAFEKVKEIESEMPYTSISFDDHHTNILYVTTLNSQVTIINLDRMTGRSLKLKHKISTLTDNWSAVIGSERAYFTHVAKNTITLYDKGTNKVIETWRDLKNVVEDITCNDISVAKQRENTSYLYFGTNHHLFLMDLRKFRPRALQRWTHGMQSVPTFMSITDLEYNKELISLSSQWVEDMCVLSNYCDRKNVDAATSGVSIPYRPPNILQVLTEARLKQLCNNLYNPIDARLCTSITGNLIVQHGDKYAVLMQNSLGDIMSHIFYPEHTTLFMEDYSSEQLHEWCKDFKLPTKELEVSAVKDIKKFWKSLKKMPENYKIGEGKFKEENVFDENEIFEAFESEEIDSGLLDVWVKEHEETTPAVDQSSLALNLHYSDDE